MNIISTIAKALTAAVILVSAVSCEKNKTDKPVNDDRRVLLFYECGFNNLGSYMRENMENLAKGYLPSQSGDVVLIYSRLSNSDSDYSPVRSTLRRIYSTSKGNVVSETLTYFNDDVIASSPSTMEKVLNYVRDEFPAKGYGMVFSSHGSGWLPAGYFYSPSRFEKDHAGEVATGRTPIRPKAIPDGGRLPVPEGDLADTDPYYGMTRSIGQDFIKNSYYGHEMDIREFASGIPFHLDYILFDMCYTGGVEVAYGLKDKADYLGLSPSEVMGAGMFDYTKITSFLLKGETPDYEGLFKDSFDLYDKQSGVYRSATVNVIRTEGLDNLATVCKNLIKEYSDTLANVPTSEIQGYFRQDRHYFYDLVDIFAKCGATESEISDLSSAISRCVIYKNATPRFMNEFSIDTYSGFSMYLPCAGTELLDKYYKKEAWNDAVGLVK